MEKPELKAHLDAIERYIINAESGLKCAYNRLKFLQDMLALPDKDYKALTEATIPVKSGAV